MEITRYAGEVWQGQAVHPDLWSLLNHKNHLIELASGERPYRVLLGAPHHAAPGEDRIAESWVNPRSGRYGRPADENIGLMGLAVFSALRAKGLPCKLVIAAHPVDHDPNKTPESPYWNSLFETPLPGIVFELHGSSKKRRADVEISAGKNRLARPLEFGKRMAFALEDPWLLAAQVEPGTKEARLFLNRQSSGGRLENPALLTRSLVHAGELGIPALHMEIKPFFRRTNPVDPRPVEAACRLARVLALLFYTWDDPDSVRISAADVGRAATAYLTRPSEEYESSFLEAVQEATPLDLRLNDDLRVKTAEDFKALVRTAREVAYEQLPGEPPEEWLWLIDRGEVIGRVLILHGLNEYRMEDGQVDYWIRPSRRRQGYGSLILRLALERFRQLGLRKVLISCRADNTGSRKIIEANGGRFENEITDYDMARPGMRRRYWIDL